MTTSQPSSSAPYGSVQGGYGGRASGAALWGNTGAASCSGEIDQTYTWQGTDPAPQSVIVTQTSSASAASTYSNSAQAAPTCDDGLQDSPTVTSNYFKYGSGYSGSASSSGTRYTLKGGASFPVSCSPNASVSISSGQCWASVTYSNSISPVTIQLTGTTKDSSGGENILVGQGCSASLVGIPSNCTTSGWMWSVGGTTFQSWDWVDPPPPDFNSQEGHSHYVDGPGPLTNPTASWHWNDLMGSGATKPETVSCTATVTPPAGQGDPFTVTATKQVTVWRPLWSAKGTGGEMRVGADPYFNGDVALWAAPLVGSGNTGGMIWKANVSSPNPALFGNGSLQIVQLVIPNLVYTTIDSDMYSSPLNGIEGLDTDCFYGWASIGPAPDGGIEYLAGDSPGKGLAAIASITLGHQFEDYLMYEPPGSAQYVPLAHFVWSINGNATIPPSGNWTDYSGSAGTVTPSGSATPFPQGNSFPDWSRVNTANDL